MKRRFLLSLFLSLAMGVCAWAQSTALEGVLTDAETGEGLINATVLVRKNGVQVGGVVTDFDGAYLLKLDPGTYDVEFSYTGYAKEIIEGVEILAGKTNKLSSAMSAGQVLDEVIVKGYTKPLVDAEQTTQGEIKTAADIRRAPTRNINTLASTAPGVTSQDNGALNVRGNRASATVYFLDGVRLYGALPPESEIEQLQVMTGGISALYGDATGGFLSLTSKGPSSKFTGGFEVETSGVQLSDDQDDYIGLDAFGNSLVGVNLSGPILKRKSDGRSTLGFRLSGRYTFNRDDNISALGTYVARDEVLDRLEANPRAGADGEISIRPPTEDLLLSDFELRKYTPNTESNNLNLTAKIDARLTDDIDISITGGFVDGTNSFAPNGRWNWFNYRNNPRSDNRTYRGIFRFRHKLGSDTKVNDAGETVRNNSQIRNFQYTLKFAYENISGETYDPRHEDNLFRYGYVGKFDQQVLPVITNDTSDADFAFQSTLNGYYNFARHTGFSITDTRFQPDFSVNPILARYTTSQINGLLEQDENGYYNLGANGFNSFDNFSAVNGRFNDTYNDVWFFSTGVGTPYYNYSKNESEIISANVDLAFDFVPGGESGSAKNNRHSIIMGFQYEERILRAFSVNPAQLWLQMRQLQNASISGVADFDAVAGAINLGSDNTYIVGNIQDIPNPDDPTADPIPGIRGVYTNALQSALFNTGDFGTLPLYSNTVEPNINFFHKNIRDELGLQMSDYVNLEGLGLDFFNRFDGLDVLGLFDPTDLVNFGSISYYGYDHTGNKVGSDVTFNSFFNDSIAVDDRTSYRAMEVAPVRPVYFAGYIEDKLKIKDAFLRVGVRVERYDANQQVLRDPYSVFPIATAADLNPEDRPAGVDDDWSVYVNNNNVEAFRDGDQWYDAEGNVADPVDLFGFGGRPQPLYADFSDIANLRPSTPPSIKSLNFDPSRSFEDYKPQVNVLPRIALSFPISDVSNFFSHYDVRVQRPTSGSLFTALNYFNFENSSGRRNNPNLLPSKTVSFEAGFQQRVSASSAIKFSFYVQEMRDMISTRLYQFLPIDFGFPEYETFTNSDFGTVKGFTFQYDLRRTGNFLMTLNYTLQYADGTGSSPTSNSSSLALIGPRRTLFPLSFDERHIINATLDYRFGSGSDYRNGPRIGGVDILANTGLNVQLFAKSGRPFTPTNNIRQFSGFGTDATFNGARLPWNFRVDARLDKTFRLRKGGPDGKRPLYLNVYLRSQNLLDTRNIVGVFSATGEPDTDGFLTSALGLGVLNGLEQEGRNVQSYRDYVTMALLVPGFYTLPRRLLLGASMQF